MAKLNSLFQQPIDKSEEFWADAAESIAAVAMLACARIGAVEAVLATHPDVAKCAVIGTNDQSKGQLPLGIFALQEGVDRDADAIKAELAQMLPEKIGAIACLRKISGVNRLPKTRSGKILRGTMRSIANGKAYNLPSTIDDPTSLDEITVSSQNMGYSKK